MRKPLFYPPYTPYTPEYFQKDIKNKAIEDAKNPVGEKSLASLASLASPDRTKEGFRAMKTAKQEIEIESLLVWAFRDQCVDRVAMLKRTPVGPAGASSGMLSNLMQLGCRVDISGHFTEVLGAKAPDDAMIVYDTVLALDEYFLDDDCGVWSESRAAGAGLTIVSLGGQWRLCREGDLSAEAIASSSLLSQACAMATVIMHAKAATRPEANEDWARPAHRPAGDKAPTDSRGRRRASFGDLDIDTLVAYNRAIYAVWHASLTYLAELLSGSLAKYEVLPPAAKAEPWLAPRLSSTRWTVERAAAPVAVKTRKTRGPRLRQNKTRSISL